MTYLFQHVITFLMSLKLNRSFKFPTLLQINDLILMITSSLLSYHIRFNIQKNTEMFEDERQKRFVIINNIRENIEFNI